MLTLWLLGYIELYFADESGFTMKPYIPYAWQKKGNTQRIFTRNKNNRLNVLGIMSLAGHLTVYHSEQTLDGEFIKNSLADFCKKEHKKPRVIVMDNGPIHHAKVVKEQFDEWESEEMSIRIGGPIFFTYLQSTFKSNRNTLEIHKIQMVKKSSL